jgi:predicted nucleic acid-binding protein
MKRIYWDTMIHAYWFEDSGALGRRVQHIHETMMKRGDIICSSLFVLSELLVGPLKVNDLSAAAAIERLFDSGEISMLPYSRQAVPLFSDLRAHHGVKSFDALHLAIAAHSGVDLFLTYDDHLKKVNRPGLPFIATLDTDLF